MFVCTSFISVTHLRFFVVFLCVCLYDEFVKVRKAVKYNDVEYLHLGVGEQTRYHIRIISKPLSVVGFRARR